MASDALEDRIRAFLGEEGAGPGGELLRLALEELEQRHAELGEAARIGQQLLQQLQSASKTDEQAADMSRQTSLQIKVLQHKLRMAEQDAMVGASERENLKAQLSTSETLIDVEQKRCKRLEKRAADLEAQCQELEAAAAFLRTENLELACTLEQYERQMQQLQKSLAQATSAPSDDGAPADESPASPPSSPPRNLVPPLRLPIKEPPSPRVVLDLKSSDDTARLSRAMSYQSTDSDSDVPATARSRDYLHPDAFSSRVSRNFGAAVAALATPRIYAFTPRLCNELLRQPPAPLPAPAAVTPSFGPGPAPAPTAAFLPALLSARGPPSGPSPTALSLVPLLSARGPSTASVLDCLKSQPLRVLVLALLQAVHPLRSQVTELQAEAQEMAQTMGPYLTQLLQCVNQLATTLTASQQRVLDYQKEAEKLTKLTDELYHELAQMKVRYATAQFEADYVLSAVENAKRLQAATYTMGPRLPREDSRGSDGANPPTPASPAPSRGYWWPFA